jgi:hypothetical protein
MLILAGSTDVEHTFSCSGLTVPKMWHSLSDESTQAATILGSWCTLPGAIPRNEIITAFKKKGKCPKGNAIGQSSGLSKSGIVDVDMAE